MGVKEFTYPCVTAYISLRRYLLRHLRRERMSIIPYASTMESIVYAMLCIKPDVAYALGIKNRFQIDPKENH